MVSIAPAVINMNRSLLKVGADNYEKSVSKATLRPATPIAKFKGIGGNTEKAAGTPDWMLDLDYAQDWTTADSLSQYLVDELGTTKVIELTPESGGKKATVTVLIVPGDMGGVVDTTTTASVSLEVIGQPVFAAGV